MALRLYDKEKPLSENPHATVLRGEFRAELVAVKRLQYGEPEVFEREIRQLMKLEHRNLIIFKAVLRNRVIGSVDVVMQLCELETLRDALVNYSHTIEWKFSIVHQISSGLAYLHENEIVHGNLTPDNILFKDLAHGRALIGNYCESVRKHSPPKTSIDLLFDPPENAVSAAGDVFALTLIICCVLVHKLPLNLDDCSDIVLAALNRKDISSAASYQRLLSNGVSGNPRRRPRSSVFEDMFNLGLPEQPYRVAKAACFVDECLKLFVMMATCAIITLLSCDAQSLNVRLMQLISEPELKYS